MRRRQVLQTAAAGTAGALAGCTDSLGVLGSGSSDSCDLAPVEDLSSVWSSRLGGPNNARAVAGEFTVDEPLGEEWSETISGGGVGMITLASPETLCCFTSAPREGSRYRFYEASTGDLRWKLQESPDPGDTSLELPDEISDGGEVNQNAKAIAGGTVYATVTYGTEYGSQPIPASTRVYALDAVDGSTQWFEPIPVRGDTLRVDGDGRLYVIGVSDALTRADPEDREREDGEWTPEPRSDRRIHVRALNAETGDTCWKWETPLGDGAVRAFGPWATAGLGFFDLPTVTENHVVVGVPSRESEQGSWSGLELYGIDRVSGRETGSASLGALPHGPVLGVADRFVCATPTPPTDEGPTDGPTLFAVDPGSGTVDWQIPASGVISAATEEAVVVQREETVAGVDPTSGDQLWTTSTTTATDVGCIAGDVIVLVDLEDRVLQTRTLTSGDPLAQTPLDDSTPLGNPVAAGGRFYFAGEVGDDRELVALE